MRSRTSRYARFDSRRNQRLAKSTGGTIDEHARARAASSARRSTIDRADEEQHVLHEHRRGPCEIELLERVDVGRHARDEPAGLLPLEEVERRAP